MTFEFMVEALFHSLIVGGLAGFVYWACVRYVNKHRRDEDND